MLKLKTFLISFALIFAFSSMTVFGQEKSPKSEKPAQEATESKSEQCIKKAGKDSCCAAKKTASKKSLRAKAKKVAFTSTSTDCCTKDNTECCLKDKECCHTEKQTSSTKSNSDCCTTDGSCCVTGASCCDSKKAGA